MRVVAGALRGKKLSTPQGMVTRPTSDRVKESLFNILVNRIDFSNIRVLDVCAGTGNLGIEAFSRGAGTCCFIECDKSVIQILNKNLVDTGCKSRSEVIAMDAVSALNRSLSQGKQFDLVFFDPPYLSDLYYSVPVVLASSALLAPGAILVIECSARHQLPESFGLLRRFDRRKYGDTALELFSLEEI